MQIYLPEISREDGAYRAHHFLMQAEYFAPQRVRLTNSLSDLSPGDWALLIRARGAFALSRQSLDMRGRNAQPTVFETIRPEEMRALRQKGGSLIVDLGWEALFTYDDVIDGLIASVEALDMDPRRIFLVHCNFAADRLLEQRWRQKTTLPMIRNVAFPVTLSVMNVWQQTNRAPEEIESRLSIARAALAESSRPKRYCFFNGEPRDFRLILLCHLAARGVLDDGFVSMLGYSKGGGKPGEMQTVAERYRQFARKVGTSEQVVDVVDQILARLPLTLDVGAEEVQSSLEQIAWSSPDPRYYHESWFSVVADTLFFDGNVLFVTEKVLKPIINASPFFHFGCAGALGHLQEWGFKLHGGLFSPDHDLLTDGKARMDAGVDRVVRACEMPERDLRDAVIEEWPIAAYNYRHFWGGFRDRLAKGFGETVLDAVADVAQKAS